MWQTLLQSASGVTKFGSYYKVRRNRVATWLEVKPLYIG